MPTAVLIDGGYFIKRFRRIEPENAYNASRAADQAHRSALAHLRSPTGEARDLYRIFFYDCPPLLKRMHNPISGECVDYARSPEALFRRELHEKLRQMRKVALRLGHLTDFNTWSANPGVLDDLLKGRRRFADLAAEDVHPVIRQKGVDMRIGIDISSLALKRQVRQIVLMAGDADFVPAAKLARRRRRLRTGPHVVRHSARPGRAYRRDALGLPPAPKKRPHPCECGPGNSGRLILPPSIVPAMDFHSPGDQ